MIKCPDCGFENPLVNEKCSCCGMFLGFPNVNDCSQREELEALEKRYKETVEYAAKKGHEKKRIEFEEAVKKSVAVINVKLNYLQMLMLGKKIFYSTYQLQTEGETRELAPTEFDKERLGIEGTLFGSYGKNIRYAALSLDGTGLTSYGEFTLILSDTAVKKRTTLLEENSYKFRDHHKILAGGKIPQGYRAVWKDRHKLAVAKLIEKVLLTNKDNYAKIVLFSTENKKKDEFIEVHIYGKLNEASIQAVRGPSESVSEKDIIGRIKDYLTNSKKNWIEE
jgi:hypothetical protein